MNPKKESPGGAESRDLGAAHTQIPLELIDAFPPGMIKERLADPSILFAIGRVLQLMAFNADVLGTLSTRPTVVEVTPGRFVPWQEATATLSRRRSAVGLTQNRLAALAKHVVTECALLEHLDEEEHHGLSDFLFYLTGNNVHPSYDADVRAAEQD